MRRQAGARRANSNHILADIGLITLSVLIAIVLARTHVLTQILSSSKELELLGSFLAGIFFTSIFTTAPAMATFGEIALSQSIVVTALLGAAGSVVGDLLIFRFVRDRVSVDIIELLREERVLGRVRKLFRFKHFRWFTLLAGGLILASPLPDELGIALLGLSKVNARYFVMLSYVFNFLGILGIGYTARMLAGI